ncbi:SARP family transcriptional regulator [Phytohabitans rumicis]|uniref:SARP family transcriptional regulator n=1 Tax=Phytohabitans rumicis TaxID=1076125 RepID=A0A6V8LP81_9ACTN|nr:SARP family transcriptional regulator [Phytohabitans rumicis]
MDALWNDPPRSAVSNLQTYVAGLRRALGEVAPDNPTRLETRTWGYRLNVEQEQVDLLTFAEWSRRGRQSVDGGDLTGARRYLGRAMALCRGRPLEDVRLSDAARPRLTAVEERLDQVWTEWVEVRLALGDYDRLIGELRVAAQAKPLRERIWDQLILALHLARRRSEALDTYQRARKVLVDELGIEPSPELQRLHAAVLSDDPSLNGSPSARTALARVRLGIADSDVAPDTVPVPVPVPAQLPADLTGFVGRTAYLGQLDAFLAERSTATAPVVCVVVGTAGVGKTSLAVHWAHRVADRFPDGQIYLDMRGFHSGPEMAPAEALPLLLAALGVPAEQIPISPDAQAALYRSLMATRRVLVVLDNVADAAQVRPLLPGSAGCLVVLTSRDRLSGLVALDDAYRMTLDVLAPADAVAVLARVAGSERTRADPEAAQDLARLCAFLPLVLRIAGARLADQPHRTVRSYVTELASIGRLAGLRVDGDERANASDAFGLSYRALPAPARRMFRLLSLVPAPGGLSTQAGAALANVSAAEAAGALDTIARLHLAKATADGRYACHDLLLEYAAELTAAHDSAAERDAAVRRLLDFYLRAAERAAAVRAAPMARLPARSAGVDVPEVDFREPGSAGEWLDAEWDNLVAALRHAAATGPAEMVWYLVDTMTSNLYLAARPAWQLVVEIGLDIAHREANPLAEAAMRYCYGLLHSRTGQFRDALDQLEQAIVLYRQVGWRPGQSVSLRSAGVALAYLGRSREAIERFRQALAIDREVDDRAGEAACLVNLSAAYEELGELRQAERALTAVLATVSDWPQNRAMALGNLGLLRLLQGRLAEAHEVLEAALAICRSIGARHREAMVLTTLGAVHRDAGRLPVAARVLAAALEIACQTSDSRVEVLALNGLATLDTLLGRPAEAIAKLDTALSVANRTGFLRGHVEALIALSETHRLSGEYALAHRHAADALAQANRSGSIVAIGHAHAATAAAALHLGDIDRCFEHARRALRTQRRAGQRLAQARTLGILAHAYHHSGQIRAADACARQAQQLSEQALWVSGS